MTSDTSEFSFETDMSFDVSTTKEAPAEDGEAKLKLHSFLSLFEKIGITKINEKYVIAENPSAGAWESLFKTARMVRDLDVHEEAGREMARICPSVFVRLAQHLKGEVLFPNLRDISILDLNLSTHYLSLIISPVLENVLLEADSESGSADGVTHLATHIFLGDLVAFSPNLRSLVIRCTGGISPLWLDTIARFHHLQSLTLNSLDMKSFENLHPLGSLIQLQDLSLVFEHQKYERSVSSNISLPHLKFLHVVGPLDVTMDLIRAIGTNNLETFSFRCAYKIPPKKQKIVPPALSKQDELLSMVSSLWGRSLKEVTIISTVSLPWDLRHLAPLRVLEKLHIEGSWMPSAVKTIYPPSTLWYNLRSLHLPANFTVTFSFVQQIAESTVYLTDILLFIDVTGDPGIDHVPALFHPLLSMTILHGSTEANFGLGSRNDANWLQLTKAARYLNALFPNLERLDAMVQKKDWDRVWELVKLCRDSSADEKRRKQVQVGTAS